MTNSICESQDRGPRDSRPRVSKDFALAFQTILGQSNLQDQALAPARATVTPAHRAFLPRLLGFVFVFINLTAFAQQNTAELSDTVTDANGAVLLNASVTVRQPLTGLTRVTHTNQAGLYTFTQLPLGQYTVSVTQNGFQTALRENVELSVGQRARLDFQMRVGEVTSELIVTAEGAQVERESAALSSVMDKDAIRELPLNGRDIVQLALLKPGVAPVRRTSDSSGSGVQLSVGGRRPNQISFVLDQTDINDANNNTPGSVSGVLLGVDTLQEFRVLTNGYSAEYGRSAGGVISAVTRGHERVARLAL
jgi:hypothetical protein